MSGARGAIDVMTAEDTALLDSMRNEAEPPEIAATPEPPEPEAEHDDAPDADDAPEATADAPAGEQPKPLSRTAKRIQELTERARKAEADKAAAEQARAVAEGVIAERTRLLTEAVQAAIQPAPVAAPAPVEIPDITTDPVGHFKAIAHQQQKRLEEQDAILRGFQEQQTKAQEAAQLRAWGSAQEAEFMAKEPAYNEAMQFMVERRKAQLAALGIVDPAAQQQIIAGDVTQIAAKSRAEGANFGERMWKVAQAFGFEKKAAEPPAPVIPPLDAGLPAADRATRAETARANATTIATVGASTPLAITPEKIGNMSDKEFETYITNVRAKSGAALRDLLGH